MLRVRECVSHLFISWSSIRPTRARGAGVVRGVISKLVINSESETVEPYFGID